MNITSVKEPAASTTLHERSFLANSKTKTSVNATSYFVVDKAVEAPVLRRAFKDLLKGYYVAAKERKEKKIN